MISELAGERINKSDGVENCIGSQTGLASQQVGILVIPI